MKGHFVKNNNQQAGSAHAIIVIVLVLVLMGSLGFIFWQNFIQKKTDIVAKQTTPSTSKSTPSTNTPAIDEIALTEIASDNLTGTNLAIKYPKTWQMSHESMGPNYDIITEKYKISSPDNKILINFWTSNGGFGGTCEDIDGDELQYINKESLPRFTNAEYIEYYFSTGYFAGIRQNNMSIDTTKIGDSACNYGMSGAVLPVKNTKNIENMALHLDMQFPEIGYKGASSVEKFKDIIKTDDYKTAKIIIRSIYVKE